MLHHFLRTLAPKPVITPAFVKSVTSTAATIATGTVAVGDLLVLIDYAISSSTTIPTTVVPSGFTSLNNYGALTGSGVSTRTIVSYQFATSTSATLTGMNDFAELKTLLVFNGGGSSVSAVNFSNTSNIADPDPITSLSSGTQNTITAVAQTSASQTTVSPTITVNVPSGTANGDLMILIVASSQLNTWTTPSGWTLWFQNNGRAIFYRTAASEPASYTVTQNNSETSDGFMLTYRNAAIDVIGSLGSNANPSVGAAITTTDSNCYVFDFVSARTNASITFTTPTGYTALISESDGVAPSAAIFFKTQSAAGTTGSATSTPSGGVNAGSMQFSLKPTYALTSPVIAIGNYQTNSSGTVTTPTFAPLQDGTITNTTAQTIRYKIFQSTGASVTIDSADGGSYNVNGVGGLQIT